MARLYKHTAELIIAKPTGTSFFDTGPNAAVIKDLRMTFKVEKTLSADPNTAEIEVTNLSEATRAAIQQHPLRLFLSAGYGGDDRQLFTGDVKWSESQREQTGWLTKIQAGDGERAYKHARVNKSFSGGVQYQQVLKEVAGSMGLKIPTNVSQAKEFTQQLLNGSVLEGPSHREMTELLEARGFNWSVQDGALQILKEDETAANSALEISRSTGMIGTPGFGSPPAKGKPPLLRVRSLLYPEVKPGSKVSVVSRTTNGLFKAVKVVHSGDTHGPEWYTEVEANPL